eukprot:gb/GEZN01006384.1/.p1 GENE.gb/GEZN01006384.1/~~gb/GEZN01006384.1/.p1  ORF type:complete len:397 (+),score=43.09 gb/GEZN01006384.1/:116-1192(+)
MASGMSSCLLKLGLVKPGLRLMPVLLPGPEKQHVLVTGGSGFLGGACTRALLTGGHRVSVTSRREASGVKATLAQTWALQPECLDRLQILDTSFNKGPHAAIDCVINLAGAPLMDPPRRWDDQQVQELFVSRVDFTQRLVRYLSSLDEELQPRVLVSGSAIGWYGVPTEDQQKTGSKFTEDSQPVETKSLSQRLCQQWEQAARATEGESKKLKARVVYLRTGIVLDGDQGALARMLPPFSLGLGGVMGSGNQWLPWIHLYDWLQIVGLALQNQAVSGPLNAVAPYPTRNADFTAALGRALGRPAFIPMPADLVRLLFGTGPADELLLHGLNIIPARAVQHGLQFKYPKLDAALAAIVK